MRAVIVAARQTVIIAIALMSLIAGAALLWGRLDRETVASASPFYLVAVLAMILLPICVILAIEIDRRARRDHEGPSGQDGQRGTPDPGRMPVGQSGPAAPVGLGRWRAMFESVEDLPTPEPAPDPVPDPGDEAEALRHAPGAGATSRRRAIRPAPSHSRAAPKD